MNKRIKEKRLSKQFEYILAAVGYIFYLTSLIEYNLVQLIAAEKYLQVFDKEDISFIDIINAKKNSNKTLHDLTDENRMLGRLITLLEKTQSVKDPELISDLRHVAEIRGYYAHEFFKEDLRNGYLEKEPLKYKKKLNEDVDFIFAVHNMLVEIDEINRKTVKIAKESGL